jgi:DUF971 family protein
MKKEIPVKIQKKGAKLIECQFKDGATFIIKLEDLRNECPCASCKPDAFHHSGNNKEAMTMGKNELVELKPVGNYALAARWQDGHDTGIYPFLLIRKIFENYNLSEEEAEEIQKKAPAFNMPQLNVRKN